MKFLDKPTKLGLLSVGTLSESAISANQYINHQTLLSLMSLLIAIYLSVRFFKGVYND